MSLMNIISNKYKRTINNITTVDGKMFDDILLPKEIEYNSKVVKLLYDHYMIVVKVDF